MTHSQAADNGIEAPVKIGASALLEKCDQPNRIAAWLAATAPHGTAVAVDRIGPSAPFDGAEEEAIARAVIQRRNEFKTGRRLAREALAHLGCVPVGLPPDRDRVPKWPDGFVGTISHSTDVCAALVGRASDLVGIGIDIEETGRMQPGLASLICRPDETDLDGTGGWTLLRFVAKEAFFKAYFPATRDFLDFQDVRVTINLAGGRFEARLMKPSSTSLCGSRVFAGRFTALRYHVIACLWIAR
jgi:4'-phosphopantetheinyl transferase EntD